MRKRLRYFLHAQFDQLRVGNSQPSRNFVEKRKALAHAIAHALVVVIHSKCDLLERFHLKPLAFGKTQRIHYPLAIMLNTLLEFQLPSFFLQPFVQQMLGPAFEIFFRKRFPVKIVESQVAEFRRMVRKHFFHARVFKPAFALLRRDRDSQQAFLFQARFAELVGVKQDLEESVLLHYVRLSCRDCSLDAFGVKAVEYSIAVSVAVRGFVRVGPAFQRLRQRSVVCIAPRFPCKRVGLRTKRVKRFLELKVRFKQKPFAAQFFFIQRVGPSLQFARGEVPCAVHLAECSWVEVYAERFADEFFPESFGEHVDQQHRVVSAPARLLFPNRFFFQSRHPAD